MQYGKKPNNTESKNIQNTKNVTLPKKDQKNKDSSNPSEYLESIQREAEESKKLEDPIEKDNMARESSDNITEGREEKNSSKPKTFREGFENFEITPQELFGLPSDFKLLGEQVHEDFFIPSNTQGFDLDRAMESARIQIEKDYQDVLERWGPTNKELYDDIRKRRLASLDEQKQLILDQNLLEMFKNTKIEIPSGPIPIRKVHITPEERAATAYRG